jgi:hypothetical protein
MLGSDDARSGELMFPYEPSYAPHVLHGRGADGPVGLHPGENSAQRLWHEPSGKEAAPGGGAYHDEALVQPLSSQASAGK